jgi:hypothetical protein
VLHRLDDIQVTYIYKLVKVRIKTRGGTNLYNLFS